MLPAVAVAQAHSTTSQDFHRIKSSFAWQAAQKDSNPLERKSILRNAEMSPEVQNDQGRIFVLSRAVNYSQSFVQRVSLCIVRLGAKKADVPKG